MGNVVLHNAAVVDGTPQAVFEQFGTASDSGWLFSAECDSVLPGSTVSLTFPLPDSSQHSVRILGRLSKVVPGKLVVLNHDQPWSGRTRITFAAVDGRRTNVTVTVELDQEGVAWLTRRLGFPGAVHSTPDTHPIGLLTSKTGPGAIFAVACENLARMSVEEINADGGVGGRPAELVVGDDGTDPLEGVREAKRLIAAGCRVIIASVTSATFEAVQQAVRGEGVALVHAVLNEGGPEGTDVLRSGDRPSAQLRAAGRPLMREAGVANWFLVGNDYSWSHGAHTAARRILPQDGGRIAGERLVDHGTTDFSTVIEQIQRSRADCILSTLVGADEVAFERQAYEAGLRESTKTLSLVLDESTHERIGSHAARGLWTVAGYFENLQTPGNRDLVARYRAKYGRWAPPISSFSEGVYEALHLYARAVAREDDSVAAARSMRRLASDTLPMGVRASGGESGAHGMYVAESAGGTLRVTLSS